MSGKKLPLGARIGLAVLSAVLGLALFLCTVVTLLIADVRVITSENSIRQLTKLALGSPQRVHSVVSVYRGAVGVPYTAGPRLEESTGINSEVTDGLIDLLYEGLKDYMGDRMTMTQAELEAVIDQSTVKDFIADKAAALVSDYIIGEVTATIDGEEIKELLQENQELIEQVIGQPLPAEVLDQIVQVVETNEVVQKLEKEGLAGFIDAMGGDLTDEGAQSGTAKPRDPNALGKQMGELFGNVEMADTIASISSSLTGGELEGLGSISDVLTLLRAATSVGKLVWGIVICLVLIAAILLVNIRQLNKGLRRSGIPLLLAGFVFVADLVALFVPSLFTGMQLQLVRQVLVMTAGVNGAAFGLGLAMIIAGFVVGSLAKKNAAKAAAQPVAVAVGAPLEASEEAVAEISEESPVEAPGEATEEAAEEAADEVTEEAAEGSDTPENK